MLIHELIQNLPRLGLAARDSSISLNRHTHSHKTPVERRGICVCGARWGVFWQHDSTWFWRTRSGSASHRDLAAEAVCAACGNYLMQNPFRICCLHAGFCFFVDCRVLQPSQSRKSSLRAQFQMVALLMPRVQEHTHSHVLGVIK